MSNILYSVHHTNWLDDIQIFRPILLLPSQGFSHFHRYYLEPLRCELEGVQDEEEPPATFCVNKSGQLIDPNGRVIPWLHLTDDAQVMNEQGKILRGSVYSEDGMLVEGPLVDLPVPEKETMKK